MKRKSKRTPLLERALSTELLILPDGQILVHSLTEPFAELLAGLNPDCEQIRSRLPGGVSSDPPPAFCSRSSAEGDVSPGQAADVFQTQTPSPQPSARSGGEGELNSPAPPARPSHELSD